jgi:hypothetical protein
MTVDHEGKTRMDDDAGGRHRHDDRPEIAGWTWGEAMVAGGPGPTEADNI